MPLTILSSNRETFGYAREVSLLLGTTYDAIHVVLVAQNNIEVVLTEDTRDWSRVLRIWPKLREKYDVKDLLVVSPTKGALTTNKAHT